MPREDSPSTLRLLDVDDSTGDDTPTTVVAGESFPFLMNPEAVEVLPLNFDVSLAVGGLPKFECSLSPNTREARLLNDSPWVRGLGSLEMRVQTEGWKFPTPPIDLPPRPVLDKKPAEELIPTDEVVPDLPDPVPVPPKKPPVRSKPAGDTVLFKDRLLYLLQPPIDHLIGCKSVGVPFEPFPYQLEGIAFLMPRHSALLADEMGLGKTAQVILAIRLLIQAGMVRKVLIVCPKPLVYNWVRELKLWASDLPNEIFAGDTELRRATWFVSNCPVKITNYELLTRDAEFLSDDRASFDLVVLDEAQRIKNHDSRTAQIVRSIKRSRSWAMSGTPIENRPEDLINIFGFVDPGRVPRDTPSKRIPQLTADCILRRTKDDVQSDMPPKFLRDLPLELTPPQREAYDLAEKEGVIRLNDLGETISVQHVFQLVMRLKQICNFDPVTGSSVKMEQLLADMEEVAANGRKAIVFSQWVEPLEVLAKALAPYGPMQFHGKIPSPQRPAIIDQFKSDPTKHVILMSYGTGSVGLNLQFTNYVFLFDRWWNPAIEDQAINRAHRVGQKHPVTVTRFLAENTIEGRIADVLNAKRKIFNDLLEQNGPPPSLGLSEDEIFGLFDIKARPKKNGDSEAKAA
ncbi:DEAD/DEAH box helicase [Zavarzinella formosa]|uniref:DEAD/DEAH box helicase n=1 Tax=Zavarzinella formosa TaxID=360055 RepID=UPI0002FFD575|nr:DEAD/DEAH box helicase [Zavarzinella formosa]